MQDFDLPLPPLPEPDEPYSPYYRADEMQAYAREAVRASRDSMRAAGWILVRADKAEKGLEPVRAFVDGLHQQKLPKKIFMESKYNGSQLMTYADDFAVQAIQQWITAHPPTQVEPVAWRWKDPAHRNLYMWWDATENPPANAQPLYAHPPTSECANISEHVDEDWAERDVRIHNDAIEAAADIVATAIIYRDANTLPEIEAQIRALKREPR